MTIKRDFTKPPPDYPAHEMMQFPKGTPFAQWKVIMHALNQHGSLTAWMLVKYSYYIDANGDHKGLNIRQVNKTLWHLKKRGMVVKDGEDEDYDGRTRIKWKVAWN